VLACALGFALVWADAPPAAAGPVCKELGLSSPCVRSNDIQPSILLGGSGASGRLRIRDAANAIGLDLRDNGNVTNRFSNDETKSNGLVKAWARINADGTIAACWRCNRNPGGTGRLDLGQYSVDFTPLATDIRGRPRSVSVDAGAGDSIPAVILLVLDHPFDESAALVFGIDLDSNSADAPFVLTIY
jgi:hypothetical protein